jgi:hypothetical protein
MLQEFNSVFGDDLSRPIELEDLNKLVYCDAIIKEGILTIISIIFLFLFLFLFFY